MNYLIALVFVMFGVFAACGVEGREEVCTPGAVVACPCAGESTPGAQTCSDDGESFGSCMCCTPRDRRSCDCSTRGKVGQQDCSLDGQWGGCYACQ